MSPADVAAKGATEKGKRQVGLENVAALWPTPAAQEPGWRHIEVVDREGQPPAHWNQRVYDKETGRLVQKGLTQIAEFWPTPKGSAANYGQPRENDRGDLQATGALWASPQSRDGKSGAVSAATLAKNSRPLNEQAVSLRDPETLPAGSDTSNGSPRLNPAFVCLLMGLPPGWVEVE